MSAIRILRTLSSLVVAIGLSACAAEPTGAPTADSASAPSPGHDVVVASIDVSAFAERDVFEPQLLSEYDDGTLLMIWRQRGEDGFDLYSARHLTEGRFSTPVRINDEAGTVYGYPHDEMRAALATAPAGRLAVVWSDSRSQIRASFGESHGESWGPSIRLDQGDQPAYRGFPAAGIDRDGALNAVWIDSRHAPQAGAEEPADLYYARVTPGGAAWEQVEEINLTADQGASVCGCCKPDLEIRHYGVVRTIFRNSDDDGYRDIWTITGDPATGFGPPVRVGPPTWSVTGCPMTGPIGLFPAGIEDGVMYREASSGQWRLETGRPGDDVLATVLTDTEDWKMTLSPRLVAARPEVVLVPGHPAGRLIERRSGSWEILHEDVPRWATTAAAVAGGVLVMGAVDGTLEAQVLDVDLAAASD